MVGRTAATAIGILALLAPSANAVAAEPTPSNDETKIRQFWEEHDVPAATQTDLIEVLKSGEAIDSMTDAEPVDIQETVSDGFREVVHRFADGSISVDSIQIPSASSDEGLGTRSVNNCRNVSSGTGYVNHYDCQASSSNGPVILGFYISYTTTPSFDQIISVDSPYRDCTWGTCDAPTLGIKKVKENSYGSAWASSTTLFTNTNGNGTTKYEMRALVGNNTAWTRWETP